ncbi:MAG TPA: hypothetical protein VNF47_18045 [Streptosporangiaceae bacterium]|nr:hypothetical protein [Streptosporangiaceae bacterium]
MRGTLLGAAALALAASVVTAGCGIPQDSASRSASAGANGRAAAHANCVTPKLSAPVRDFTAPNFTITNKDNGKSFCVQAGTGIFVFLHGTPAVQWTRIQPSSSVLAPKASGVMMLMRGVTGGFFVTAKLGTATLTSTKPPCQASSGSARPGMSHCTVQTVFRVTVLVLGRM